MSGDNLGKHMAEFLRLLAIEVESNKAMAKRLADPFRVMIDKKEASLISERRKSKKKETVKIPEGFDPFQIYYDKGAVGLYNELAGMDARTLKAVLSHFTLDPSRSYSRWRKPEKLVNLIIERVKAMSSKGQVFME